MSNLQMSLKSQWFEITKAGIKTEDYRSINEYWVKRFLFIKESISTHELLNAIIELNKNNFTHELFAFKKFDFNIMTLGYPKSTDSSRILKLEHKGIEIGYGKEELGAEPNKLYFIIKHGEILNNE